MARLGSRTVRLGNGSEVVLRDAEPGDAAGLIELFQHIALTAEYNVTLPDEAQDKKPEKQATTVRELLEQDNAMIQVAESGGRLVGEISYKGHARQRMRHHGHFGIGLHADWRGVGLGTEMIRTLLDWARGHPYIEKVCLGVFAENEHAIGLYKKMGFVEECRRRGEFKYGPGRYMDDIQMSVWVKARE